MCARACTRRIKDDVWRVVRCEEEEETTQEKAAEKVVLEYEDVCSAV